MIYNTLIPLINDYPALNLFRYISFRSAGAVVTALVLSFLIGPAVIAWLKKHQSQGQPLRADGPPSHLISKRGTPTMGGILIFFSLGVSTLLWADWSNSYIWALLLTTGAFAAVGAWDDLTKIMRRSSKGISGWTRIGVETAVAFGVGWWLLNQHSPEIIGSLTVPFFKDVVIPLGVFYIPFAALTVIASANAVNLTDGLDGLAIVPSMIALSCYGLIAWVVGNAVFADYLQLVFVPGVGELTIFCAAFIGAGLGFLWFNAPPASIFMGDMGSLAVGAALGTIALMVRHEVLLIVIGGLFVFEALSVIIQVTSFKLTGRRVFRMAPIHHHFEQRGWPEATVVIRFWIIAFVLALAGLATLKIR